MNRKRTRFSVFVGLVLLLTSIRPTAGPLTTYPVCVPGMPAVATYPVTIRVYTDKRLVGKFFYPKPNSVANFEPNTLPGVMMTHGFGETYANVEDMAHNLAENCMVALVFNFFGQGDDADVDTNFEFYTTDERDQLVYVITELKRGPIYTDGANDLDLVDDSRLGITGASQGGIVTWMMVADPVTRGQFLAAAPVSSSPFMYWMGMSNNCLIANMGNIVDPKRARWSAINATPTPSPTVMPGTPSPTPLPTRQGAYWDPAT